VPVGDAVVAMAECDVQLLGQLLPRVAGAANQNAGVNDAPPDAVAETTARRDGALRDDDDAHVGVGDRDGAVDSPVDTAPRAAAIGAAPSPRAKQSIPPAVRRAVLARDQHRCRVPGCTHATFVDVHHIRPRSEGGGHDPDNLITLCGAHHRASHRGELIIEAQPGGAPTFRHADGTDYGHAVTPRVVDAHAKVFSGLRNLGFREREIRAVLAELLADEDLRDTSPERLLREALCRIRIPRQ
jgi:HNH endonuclease/RuvA, C-terminal domain